MWGWGLVEVSGSDWCKTGVGGAEVLQEGSGPVGVRPLGVERGSGDGRREWRYQL